VNIENFLSELKRRNVYKVAAAYAVVGWLIVQVATQVFPFFEIPNWAIRLVVLLIVIGFPIALVIAWAFESSPKGIDRTMVADALHRHSRGKAWIYVVIIGALLSVALFFLGRCTARNSETIRSDASLARAEATADKSIAVLPFDNLSRDPDNAYFAEGVQDEILTDLAKVADLKVISRTSVMQYKNAATRNLREIAQQLGVAHLLEGSVQRAGGKVRVNAQLIDARNDAHVWAQTYDRDLADVFAIQSEIAQTIAEQLRAHLSPTERAAIAQPPTTDVVANDLYVRARTLDDQASDPGAKPALLQGVSLLEEAVRRDPNFLVAYCLLCETHLDLYWGGFDHTDARREQARVALEHAEQLRPDAGEVHLQKGNYAYHGFRDYDRARPEFEIARQLLPNSARVYTYLASVDRRQSRWDETIRNFARARELDPRNIFILEESSFTQFGLRHFAEAKTFMERALALDPTNPFIRVFLAWMPCAERADVQPLRSCLNEILKEGKERAFHVAFTFVTCSLADRNRASAQQALDLVPPEGAVDFYDSAWPRDWFAGLISRSFGDQRRARKAFQSARVVAEKNVKTQADYAANWEVLGAIDAGLGRKDEAIAEGKRACELLPISKDGWDGPSMVTNLALIYTWLGEKDLALEQLEISAKAPSGISYGELKLNPVWDPLRNDSRFEKILSSSAPK
jgi:TolB-like protein/Tfp pilus assembly protein PilF